MAIAQPLTRAKRNEMIKAIYNNIYKDPDENKKYLDILVEVKTQDKICRDFCRILTENEIKTLLQCKTIYQVYDKARAYKYEKLKLPKNKYSNIDKAKAKTLSA